MHLAPYRNQMSGSIKTRIASVVDLTSIEGLSNSDSPAGLPGVLLTLEERIKLTASDHYLDGLMFGSSAVPVGFVAFTLNEHAIHVLFNPLDPGLRPKLQAQRDAGFMGFAVIAHNGVVRGASRMPVHDVALARTVGRQSVSKEAWMQKARETVDLMPIASSRGPAAFRAARRHHAFLLMCDDA